LPISSAGWDQAPGPARGFDRTSSDCDRRDPTKHITALICQFYKSTLPVSRMSEIVRVCTMLHDTEDQLYISVSVSAICHLYLYNDIMIHYMPYITVYIYHYTYIIKICRSPRLDRTRFDVGLGVRDKRSHFAWRSVLHSTRSQA
jgi:hypothetical protein